MIEYLTVQELSENTTVIERSKFICYIKSINDEIEAKEFIEEIRKKHSLANHSCYAYIADEKGLNQKFSDAGEPQGTAGMPMLNVLRGKNLYKTVAVVVRYFGGIKLGTGGLTRAYGGAVSDCLEKARIVRMTEVKYYEVITDYDGYSKLLKFCEEKDYKTVKTDFTEKVIMKIAVPNAVEKTDKFLNGLKDLFKGKEQIVESEVGYYGF